MRPIHQQLTKRKEYSFNYLEVELPFLVVPWHYHPEYEILLVIESTGIRFLGDSIEPFQEGDLVLVGPNIPHVWQNDKEYKTKNPNLKAKVDVIHFTEDIFGENLLQLFEFDSIKQLLEDSKKGIHFSGKQSIQLIKIMTSIKEKEGVERLLTLYELLDKMGSAKNRKFLCSDGYNVKADNFNSERIQKVNDFLLDNYKEKISLQEVADIINMHPTTFCRYFKKQTGKTYTQFLNHIRIGNACKMLMEDDYKIIEICYESGFNNVSNFIEQFTKITGMTPIKYKKKQQKEKYSLNLE